MFALCDPWLQGTDVASAFSGVYLHDLSDAALTAALDESGAVIHGVISTLPPAAFAATGEVEGDSSFVAGIRGVLASHRPVVMDVAYRPAVTPLLALAASCGCDVTVHGLAMLLHQAYEQFECWTHTAAPRHLIAAAVNAALE